MTPKMKRKKNERFCGDKGTTIGLVNLASSFSFQKIKNIYVYIILTKEVGEAKKLP
jgi:hypothetical protein